MPTPAEQTETSNPPHSKEISGKWVVMAMFLFGACVTAVLFFYWSIHTARFRPLQDAIAVQFEGSMPRVEGGQRKKHLELSPVILRVTMKVTFDPTSDLLQAREHATTLTKFIHTHDDLRQFDQLELHFYQLNPEAKIKQKTYVYQTESLSLEKKEEETRSDE